MFLIDDLLLAPVNGFKFILGQIQKLADQELNDDTLIKEQLLELEMRRELDEVRGNCAQRHLIPHSGIRREQSAR